MAIVSYGVVLLALVATTSLGAVLGLALSLNWRDG
jgi:hypothetical protein